MECNRDEALRAKSIAESKLEKQDLAGAKKFALKAQNLYPKLDGISQFLTTIDVYASAENKLSGEVDWYTVLSVDPSDNDQTIKKQFRKLALLLHPDKNKSVGANGAFELISEAWSLLSDKAKRFAYDRRRGCKVFQQKAPVPDGGPPAPPTGNQFHNFTNRTTSVPKTQNNTAKVPMKSNPAPCSKTKDCFWTKCDKCKVHYEHLIKYLNCTLLCPNCKEAFLALETDPPKNIENNTVKVPLKSNPAPCSKTKDCFWTKCDKCNLHYEHVIKYLKCTLLCPNCKEAFLASETDPPKNIENNTVKVPLKDCFWTVCNHCKTHYEHRRMYLNCMLLCPNCKKVFSASETAPPPIKAEKRRKREK